MSNTIDFVASECDWCGQPNGSDKITLNFIEGAVDQVCSRQCGLDFVERKTGTRPEVPESSWDSVLISRDITQ